MGLPRQVPRKRLGEALLEIALWTTVIALLAGAGFQIHRMEHESFARKKAAVDLEPAPPQLPATRALGAAEVEPPR